MHKKFDKVAEADSHEMCKPSKYIVNLVEKFVIGDQVFLVT